MWTLYTFLRRPHGCIGQFLQLLQCTLADTGVVKTGYCCQKASFRLNVFVLLYLSAQKVSLFSLIRPRSHSIKAELSQHSDSVLVGGRSERPQSNLGPGSELSLGSDTPSPWSSSTTQSSSAWSAPPPSTSPRQSSLVWILVYTSKDDQRLYFNYILLPHLISVNSVLMRRSAVTESEKKPENEDSPTLKEDENKDSLLEHEYWQDESTKL